MESKKLQKAKEKLTVADFETQTKDIRFQFTEQLRCIEQRTEAQVSLLNEVQEYYRRRAEIELEYSKNLDKLAKQTLAKCKADKQKQELWSLFSLYSLWKQLIGDTRAEAKNRALLADVYTAVVTPKLGCHAEALQRILRKCRDAGSEAHQEILRVLSELHTALKTYQLCHAASCQAQQKFETVEAQKIRFEDAHPKKLNSRKFRLIEREFEKKQAKYQEFKLKSLRARNEYLLCINAANAALHKYFAEDLSDLLDFLDLGAPQWLGDAMSAVITAGGCVIDSQQLSIETSKQWLEALDPRAEKQRFLEQNHSLFVLPKRFEFQAHRNDEISQVSAQKLVQDDLIQRYCQLSQRLTQLRTETEEIWKTLETTEKTLLDMVKLPDIKVVDSFRAGESALGGEVGRRASFRDKEGQSQKRKEGMTEVEDFYALKFKEYLLTSNLIQRLQARYEAIGGALGAASLIPGMGSVPSSNRSSVNGSASVVALDDDLYQNFLRRPPSLPPKPRKKRIGQGLIKQTPKLFGGSLEEYVEATGQEIPLVIRSCIRVISLFGLHHQGVFRVSGSQLEINAFKEAFEKGEDPLADVADSSDMNSIAGVFKLYFRELREPLFPLYMFDQFVDCSKCDNKEDFIERLKALVHTLSRPIYVVMRYLFAFLNHLAEFSDESMMDPYNLAICFGPTLIPIPESRDQVEYHNYVNNLVKNLIIYQEEIFTNDGGIVYEKYLMAEQPTEGEKLDEEEEDQGAVLASEDELTGSVECLPEILSSDSLVGFDLSGHQDIAKVLDSPVAPESPTGPDEQNRKESDPVVWRKMEPLDQLALAIRGSPSLSPRETDTQQDQSGDVGMRKYNSYQKAIEPGETKKYSVLSQPEILSSTPPFSMPTGLLATKDSPATAAVHKAHRSSIKQPLYVSLDNQGLPDRRSVRSEGRLSSTSPLYLDEPALSDPHEKPKKSPTSPDSLKELQVELKAVLNSLESFTQQSKKRTMSDELVQMDRTHPNFHVSPLSAYLSATPTSNNDSLINRQSSTPVAPTRESPNSSLSRPTVYPLPPCATNIPPGYNSPTAKDTPDLVQNLPRTQITPPNSEGSSPDSSDVGNNNASDSAAPDIPATSTPEQSHVYDMLEMESGREEAKRESILAEPESSSILGSNLDLSGSFADCFAEEKRTTLRRAPTPPTSASGSVKLGGGESPSQRSSLASFALVGTSLSSSDSPVGQNEYENLPALMEPRPVVMRSKPPVPKKPQPYGAAECQQMSKSVRSWSREPVEILKM